MGPMKYDHIQRLTTLTMTTLSGFFCLYFKSAMPCWKRMHKRHVATRLFAKTISTKHAYQWVLKIYHKFMEKWGNIVDKDTDIETVSIKAVKIYESQCFMIPTFLWEKWKKLWSHFKKWRNDKLCQRMMASTETSVFVMDKLNNLLHYNMVVM